MLSNKNKERKLPDPKKVNTPELATDYAQREFGYGEKRAVQWARGWINAGKK